MPKFFIELRCAERDFGNLAFYAEDRHVAERIPVFVIRTRPRRGEQRFRNGELDDMVNKEAGRV